MQTLMNLSFLSNAHAQDAHSVPASALPAGSATTGAAGAAAAGAQAPQPGPMQMLAPFAIMFAVIYFFMIRPQQKRMKEHQSLIGALKNGDDVVTNSGIFGKVSGLTEKVVTLEVADQVKIKVLKSQIAQVVKDQIQELA